MNEESPLDLGDLGAALKVVLHEVVAQRGEHPTGEALLTHARNGLGGKARERMEEHLAHCPDCAEAVQDLAQGAHLPWPEGIPELSAADLAADLGALQARLGLGAGEPLREVEQSSPEKTWEGAAPDELEAAGGSRSILPFRPPPAPAPSGPSRAHLAMIYALAASLLVAAVGLGIRNHTLRRDLGAAGPGSAAGPGNEVAANLAVVDLLPLGEGQVREDLPRGVETSWPTEEETLAPGGLLLVLNVLTEETFPAWRVEVFAAGSTEAILRRDDLHPRPAGNFTLALPPGYLPPGTWHLLLSGLGETGESVPVAEYELVVGGG